MLPLNFDPVDAGHKHVERRWGGSAAAGAAALSVMRVNEILMDEVNRTLAPFGLNISRYETLMLLSRGNGGLPLRLRSGPSLSGSIIDRLQPGSQMTLQDGPRNADGHAWWHIRTTNGKEGWVAGEDLRTQPD